MLSISETFEKCRQNRSKALIPYLTCGFPDIKTFTELYYTIASSGADLIEVGIPFSDPLADGKSIQFSSRIALENGITVTKVLEIIDRLNHKCQTPPILMTYYNPIYAYGLSRFARHAQRIGVKGLIIPDIIPEEGQEVELLFGKHNLDLIYLVAPTTSAPRRKSIARRSNGFVYLVSIAGVTGARKNLPPQLNRWIRRTKTISDLPVCVGFGITNATQAKNISRLADGVIIGSAIVEIIRNNKSRPGIIRAVGKFIKNVRKGMDHVQS